MGIWMFRLRKGKTTEATIFGVILLTAAVIYGKYVPFLSLLRISLSIVKPLHYCLPAMVFLQQHCLSGYYLLREVI